MESINLNIDNIVDEKNPFFGYVNSLERALELVRLRKCNYDKIHSLHEN